jgi:hypothetical protein
MRSLLIASMSLLASAACSKPEAPAAAETPSEGAGAEPATDLPAAAGRRMFIECPADTRGAEMCTEDYTPVCGQHADGSAAKTYSNVCNACKDANVTGYFTGACETGENE